MIPYAEMTCRYCGMEYYDDEIESEDLDEGDHPDSDEPQDHERARVRDTRLVDLVAFLTLPIAALVVGGLVAGVLLALAGSFLLLLALGGWVALFGSIGALIGPRKGLLPRDGFIIAGVFGIFGVAYVALKEDV